MLTSSPSSSSSSSQWKYDVFLSFRGEDTRKSFTDHLYSCLQDHGIITFRDDEKLEQGEDVAPELLKAIGESWCSVVVFSETYAFSSWCLKELVEILKQKDQRGHKVFPIFYHVDPSDLRKQTGNVKEAFAKHEDRYNQHWTQIWRDALSKAADISGWHLKDRYESKFIGDIVKKISAKLGLICLSVPNNLIGIRSRLDELYDKIKYGEDDVRIVGICGMGGIGKTTLAKVVYTQMSGYFESKCFFAGVREVAMNSGLDSLQKQLLSKMFPGEEFRFSTDYEGNEIIRRNLQNKKVIVVIDDAANIRSLECLAKREWLGLGSRIIITTRDESLLQAYGVDDVYKPTTLCELEALRLLSLKAFKSDTPKDDFMSLSEGVVKYAGGLPLALEVLGSFLCNKDADQWISAIESLKSEPDKEINSCLKISFDGLPETRRKIFLDIAHFFNGWDKDFVKNILDGCGYHPEIGLSVLIERSLITVEDNKILMHDLLQEMGRYIVRQKSPNDPGRRCRLSEASDVYQVLTQNLGTEAIEGMVINSTIWEQNQTFTLPADAFLKMMSFCPCLSFIWEQNETFTLSADALSKMTKLRLLIVRGLLRSSNLKHLSKELRLLEWRECPLKSLPWGFQPDNLVALLLPNSCIEQLWEGKRPLKKLKVVNLQDSTKLIKISDFTKAETLDSLNLEGCTSLVHVHPSIAFLPKLKLLNLRNCKSLRSFPTKIGVESLETLILSSCSKLKTLPDFTISENLESLELEGCTSLVDVHPSIAFLPNLKLLNLRNCTSLRSLPTKIGMESLVTLILSGCSKLDNLPDFTISKNLQSLELEGCTSLVDVHPSIVFLPKLKLLNLRNCTNLRNLPTKIGMESLKTLILSGCTDLRRFPEIDRKMKCLQKLYLDGTGIEELPSSVGHLSNLKLFNLSGCSELENLSTPFINRIGRWVLSSSLNLMLFKPNLNPMALTLPRLSGLSSLTELNISSRNLCEEALPSDICSLSSLKTLILSDNDFVSLPANLCQLTKLRRLELAGCDKLGSLPELPPSLRAVGLNACTSLERVPNPTKLYKSDDFTQRRIYYYGVNCFKLAPNDNALRMLKGHLKEVVNARLTFEILIPGSEIFEWFTYQSEVNSESKESEVSSVSVGLALPCNLLNDSEWMGIAYCCVLVPPSNNDAWREAYMLCNFQFDRVGCHVTTDEYKFDGILGQMSKDHLWLLYFPRSQLENHWMGDLFRRSTTFGITFSARAIYFKVKKCGARLVYRSDMEDMDPTTEQRTLQLH